MSAILGREPPAASPWMLAASVSLHCGLILVAVVLSSFVWKHNRPPEPEVVTQVRLVGSPAPPPVRETIESLPSEPAEVSLEESAPAENSSARQTIQARASAPAAPPVIALKPRKRTAKRVEVPQPKPEKKPEPVKPKPKEDHESVVAKSLAAAKKRVEAGNAIGATARPGASAVDEESARWREVVKQLVNSHWSILADNRPVERVTVIGLKLADDGRLLYASIKDSSGDEILDNSAMRAVHQAAPFPPIPESMREIIKAAGGLALEFAPGGLQ